MSTSPVSRAILASDDEPTKTDRLGLDGHHVDAATDGIEGLAAVVPEVIGEAH